MKKIRFRILALALCLCLLAPLFAACGGVEDTTPADTTPPPEEVFPTDVVRITIDPANIYDEHGLMVLDALVDEQDTCGDPTAGTGTRPKSTPKSPGGWKDGFGLSIVIDLGADFHITSVYSFQNASDSSLTVAMKADRLDAWGESKTGTGGAKWIEIPVEADGRYLHLSHSSASYVPAEIMIYGYRTGRYVEIPEPTPHTYPTIGELMGLNGNVASDPADLTAGTYLREYHNWLWTEHAENWEKGLPSADYLGASVGNFDSFYFLCNRRGIKVVPCLMFTDDFALFESGQSRPSAPLADGSYDSDNPATYHYYAGAIYQYVARYGMNDFTTVIAEGNPDHEHDWSRWAALEDGSGAKEQTCDCGAIRQQNLSTIRVLMGGKKVGLGYIEYIELGNEPNLDWEHEDDHHTAAQLAALCSACYDGHEGTMGAGYGAKYADPNIKVVMGGLAGDPLEYIRAMHLWAQFNRQDGEVPMDVINVHAYCEKRVKIDNRYYTVGVSPEEYGLAESLQDIVEWRNVYYPDREIWLSEFGWDTSGLRSSSVAVLAYGDYTTRQLQAMWLVRGFLLLSASGIDKAQMFMCDGENDNDGYRFATCGLIDGNGARKESWYHMRTLLTTMRDHAFVEEIDTGREDLMIYHYKNAEGKSAYAVWCPTSNSTRIENYTFKINGTAADLVEFADKQEYGVTTPLTVAADGTVTITATEQAILIVTK